MDAQLEIKLIECLDALAQGESVERILARYPQDAAQLRPLLETAAGLPTLRMEPSEAAMMQSRQKFMAQADLLRRTTPRKSMGFLPRFATGFIAAAVVAVALSTGAVAASGSALPGDPLYGLKRTVENAQLNFSGSTAARESLADQFAQRRRDEVNQLLSAGRPGEVEFTGPIEAMQPAVWIVSNVVVQIDANTQIDGTPQINRLAEVRGVTGPTGLRAAAISIESSGEPGATSTPEVTDMPKATETPEPTETGEPETTSTPQPTGTPRPTVTVQPSTTTKPAEVEFSGSVAAMGAGAWNIDGTTIIVDGNTEIRGTINPGQRVKVKALRLADGRLIATRIEPADGGENSNFNGNDNQNTNQNSNEDGNSNGNDNSGNSNSNDDGGNSNSNDNGGNTNSNDNGSGSNGNDNGGNSNSDDNGNENDNDGNGNGN
jgi:hypothetical protein